MQYVLLGKNQNYWACQSGILAEAQSLYQNLNYIKIKIFWKLEKDARFPSCKDIHFTLYIRVIMLHLLHFDAYLEIQIIQNICWLIISIKNVTYRHVFDRNWAL